MKIKPIMMAAPIVILIAAGVFWTTRKSYEVVSAKKGSVTEAVYGLGVVKSHKIYDVKVGVLYTIDQIFADEGNAVKKGSKLVSFDGGPSFTAPFDGTVTSRKFNVGEMVQPQTPVLRVEDLKDLFIEVSLEQEGALQVSPGNPVKVLFESVRGEVLSGKVESLFPRNGEFIANIAVEKLGEKVLPGMTADVTIEVGKIDDATLIPISAIHNSMVIVRREGKKKKIKVEIGHIDSLWAEIKGDAISLNDEILIPARKN